MMQDDAKTRSLIFRKMIGRNPSKADNVAGIQMLLMPYLCGEVSADEMARLLIGRFEAIRAADGDAYAGRE